MGFLPDLRLPPIGLPNSPTYSYLPDMLTSRPGLPNMGVPSLGLPNLSWGAPGLPNMNWGGSFLSNLPQFGMPRPSLPDLRIPGYSLWDNSRAPTTQPTTSTPPSSRPGGTTATAGTGASAHVLQYMPLINQVASESGVPADVLAGIMETENSDANSVSPAGARGLMQVIGGPFDPLESIRAGAQILKDKMRANHYAPDDWTSTSGAYYGLGKTTGPVTTEGYMRNFAANRAHYTAVPAQPYSSTLRSDLNTAQNPILEPPVNPMPIPAANYGYGGTGRNGLPIRFIINHVAAGNGSLYGQFAAGGVNAHFWVGKDGRIEQYVPISQPSYGAGIVHPSSSLPPEFPGDGPDYNRMSINIEREGQANEWPTEAQWQSLITLNKWLAQEYHVPVDNDHIVGHYRSDPINRATDPYIEPQKFMDYLVSGMVK